MLKNFGWIFFINIGAAGILVITSLLSHLVPSNIFLRLFESLMILIVIFPLFGLNLTLILEKLTNQYFDLFEHLALVALFSITLPPLLLLGEFSILHKIFPALPFLNTAIIFLLTIILCPFGIERILAQSDHSQKKYIYSAILAGLILLLIIAATAGAYYPLPESDPYYWLTKIQHEITTEVFPTEEAYRPLISYLVYLFTVTANVDLYAFFKYIFPCFLILTIFPASLIARRLSNTFDQLVFILLPLSSASIITYFLLPIPQALINIFFTFFIFFMLHAIFTRNYFFSCLAGTTLLAGYFYHEIALLFLAPWLIISIIFWKKLILNKIATHKFITLLLILLVSSYHNILILLFNFFKDWFVRIIPTIEHLETNFSFPLTYVNIDGRVVGWSNYLGGFKYYLFYGGPILFIAIVFFFITTLSSRRRVLFLHTYQEHKEIITLFLTFILFFCLAEILPRFLNLALLPERALGFAGHVSISFFPLIYFLLTKKWKKYLIILISISLIANVSAALYINSLKKNLISPARIYSMQWIKYNLPSNRLIIVHYDLAVMKTFSQTESLLEISNQSLYTDITIFNQAISSLTTPVNHSKFGKTYTDYLSLARESLSRLTTIDPLNPKNIPVIKKELEDNNDLVATLLNQIQSGTLEHSAVITNKKPIYIYYAKQQSNGLYSSRPYYQKEKAVDAFVFNNDRRFSLIFNDQENQIFIWKYTP